jgi:hypothetical protein
MKKFALTLCIFLLAGCFSTKNSTFYLLESQGTVDPVTQKKFSIAVQDINIPDYLQKPQIILQAQNSPELKVSEFNRWGSDLQGMLQNTLIEDLQSLMPNAFIKPLMYGQSTQYTIQINIEKLSGYFKEQAVLKGTYKILLPNGKIFKEKTFDLSTPAGKTYGSYVTAQSNLISKLAQEIASGM